MKLEPVKSENVSHQNSLLKKNQDTIPPPKRTQTYNFSHPDTEALWREKQCADDLAYREQSKNQVLNEEIRMLRTSVATLDEQGRQNKTLTHDLYQAQQDLQRLKDVDE